MSVSNYISQKGFDVLSAEYQQLKTIERPKITELVAWAASLGDRSENADYKYGKKRLREIDSRLRFLSKRIAEAVIVDYLQNKDKVIRFGATVELQDCNGCSKIIHIVGVDEVDTISNKLSWRSPIAKAIIGKTEDDAVTVLTPTGETEYQIIHVSYLEW